MEAEEKRMVLSLTRIFFDAFRVVEDIEACVLPGRCS